MLNKVSAVVLFAQDYEKCLAFYRDILGCQVVVSEPKMSAFKMENQDFALMDMAEAAALLAVDVSAFEPQTGKVDRIMLCADSDNVDAVYETLKARGVAFARPPIDLPWGFRAIYFQDPEGNTWEIRQRIPAQQ